MEYIFSPTTGYWTLVRVKGTDLWTYGWVEYVTEPKPEVSSGIPEMM
jgi:hypothetical protein